MKNLVSLVNYEGTARFFFVGGRGSNERLALVILLVRGTKVLEK